MFFSVFRSVSFAARPGSVSSFASRFVFRAVFGSVPGSPSVVPPRPSTELPVQENSNNQNNGPDLLEDFVFSNKEEHHHRDGEILTSNDHKRVI